MYKEGPYLREQHRLQDVLAALQFLANYPDYDLTSQELCNRIAPRSADDWDTVLSEHPEFFRKSKHGGDYSLVLRRAKPKSGNREHHPALEPAELSMLIETAIHLQKHELEMRRERRWPLPIFLTAIGESATALAGTLLGVWIKSGG